MEPSIRKKYSVYVVKFRAQKLAIWCFNKSLLNLVKDLFKWIEGLRRSVTVWVKSEGQRIFDLGGIRKKYSIRCQISRSKTSYMVFQHKSLLNLVKDFFKCLFEQSEGQRIFEVKKSTLYVGLYIQIIQIEGLRRSVTVRVQSEGQRIFDLGGIRKKYSIRCQISRSKTSYMVFQHKSLLNLVEDLFKWIEGLRRSVTVRVQSEAGKEFLTFKWGGIRGKNFWPSGTLYVVKFRAEKLAIWCFNINRFWT